MVGPKLNALPGTILLVLSEIGVVSGDGAFFINPDWPGGLRPAYDWKP